MVAYSVRGVIVILRITRAFKLVNKWKALGETASFLWGAIADIANFAILLGLFIFIFALIGRELFANQVKFNSQNQMDLENGESMRVNFDTIEWALLATFTLQIGDSWSTYFVNYTRFNSLAGRIFFPAAIFVLNIVVMNLFVAILLEKFFSDDQQQAMAEEEKRDQVFNERQHKIKELALTRGKYKKRTRTLLTALKAYKMILSLGNSCMVKRRVTIPTHVLKGVSLNLFDEKSSFRLFVTNVAMHWTFQTLCYLATFVNSVVLSFYTPIYDPNGTTVRAANIIDWVATAIFCLEIALKVVSLGLVTNGEESYLRSPENVLDLVATLVAIVMEARDVGIGAAFKILMLVRVLRVVRLLNICEAFRLRIRAIVNGSPKIMQTMFMTLLFIVLFGIAGVHFFKERFYYCDTEGTENGEAVSADIKDIYDCMNWGLEWKRRDIGFDNILLGCMTLFELFSGKSWCSITAFLPDLSDPDMAPQREVRPHNVWFAVIYMIICYLFIRSLLTGVISNTFYFHNEELQGLHELTGMQRRWVSLSKIIFKVSPVKAVISVVHEPV